MNNDSIEHKMLQLLGRYHELIVQQLTHHALVGEYFSDTEQNQVRLLCQMRTIAFLLKVAPLFDTTADIALAEKLYLQAEKQYLTEDGWLQYNNNQQPANLYSYSFVLLAQSYLYKATNDSLYAVAMAETFTIIEQNFNKAYWLFKPVSEGLACFEQNSAMHLYEALSFACYQADAIYLKPIVAELEYLIQQVFWRTNKALLAEKITANKEVLTYELGHCLEWVSLLSRVRQWGGTTRINPDVLYHASLTKGSFTTDGLVCNEMDAELQPINAQQNRIWPNLEYLRAKTLMEKKLPNELAATIVRLFFDEKGLPLEYLGMQGNQSIKTTTGYHIAESFVDVLDIINK